MVGAEAVKKDAAGYSTSNKCGEMWVRKGYICVLCW